MLNVNKGAIKKGKKVNVPPQNREAFTSAIASSGNSKQEIQLLNREVVRMRGGGGHAGCWRRQAPTAARCLMMVQC